MDRQLKALLIFAGSIAGGMFVLAELNADARRALYIPLLDLRNQIVLMGLIEPALKINADGVAQVGARMIDGWDLGTVPGTRCAGCLSSERRKPK